MYTFFSILAATMQSNTRNTRNYSLWLNGSDMASTKVKWVIMWDLVVINLIITLNWHKLFVICIVFLLCTFAHALVAAHVSYSRANMLTVVDFYLFNIFDICLHLTFICQNRNCYVCFLVFEKITINFYSILFYSILFYSILFYSRWPQSLLLIPTTTSPVLNSEFPCRYLLSRSTPMPDWFVCLPWLPNLYLSPSAKISWFCYFFLFGPPILPRPLLLFAGLSLCLFACFSH